MRWLIVVVAESESGSQPPEAGLRLPEPASWAAVARTLANLGGDGGHEEQAGQEGEQHEREDLQEQFQPHNKKKLFKTLCTYLIQCHGCDIEPFSHDSLLTNFE